MSRMNPRRAAGRGPRSFYVVSRSCIAVRKSSGGSIMGGIVAWRVSRWCARSIAATFEMHAGCGERAAERVG